MNVLQLFGGIPMDELKEEHKLIIIGEIINGKG